MKIYMRHLFVLIFLVAFPNQVLGQSLQVLINSDVNQDGQVGLALSMKNTGSKPVFHIQPMFHFHHSMSMMTVIRELGPGQSITLENDKHPPVLRVGRYPISAMVKYKTLFEGGESKTILHTDSFYFEEPVKSQVAGSIQSSGGSASSNLRIMIQNNSDSLKNIRMMLLLPPGMVAEKFNGMMGFTLRGNEKKNFDVTVKRGGDLDEDRFPVRLMVEYGEMLKHYSGEIRGVMQFSPSWYSAKYMPHFTALVVLGLILIGFYFRFYNSPLNKKGNTNA
ncbi:MAG: hypothetical protein ACI8PD_001371 [Nitrospinales bacterium]|jgi:hypothetical protein